MVDGLQEKKNGSNTSPISESIYFAMECYSMCPLEGMCSSPCLHFVFGAVTSFPNRILVNVTQEESLLIYIFSNRPSSSYENTSARECGKESSHLN